MESQIQSIIELAFNHTTDRNLRSQANDYLSNLRADDNGWRPCLDVFVRAQPVPPEVVRVVCVEVVNHALQSHALGWDSLEYIRTTLMDYVRQRYLGESSYSVDSVAIQNKLTQTMTYVFTLMYESGWPGFFDDLSELAGGTESLGTSRPLMTTLYLKIIGSIHDEIADVMIPRTQTQAQRCGVLKDLVRSRDAGKIAITWQEILSRWRQLDLSIVELCLRTVAKWVAWIDIKLVINASIQSALLELAGQQGTFASDSKEALARDAAIDTFTEIVAKKMSARDKVELVRYLNLSDVVAQLVTSAALTDMRATSDYDTDLAETVAKLVNNVVFDVVKVLDTVGIEQQTLSEADQLLQAFYPYMLRFFGDEYDEICSAMIPALTDLLAMLRRHAKAKGSLTPQHAAMLRPILNAIIAKMKYDETALGSEMIDDETDEAEFQDLRKRLHILQQNVAAIDETLYIEVVVSLVASTFDRLNTAGGSNKPNWQELDLAMHEMYLFGELAVRNGGLYQKSHPSSEASQQLLHMMAIMVESGLARYRHQAIQLQYMETCVRYVQFFEHNASYIPRVLEEFVGFVHSSYARVRLRSWYLFQRFVRHLRSQLGNVASTVVHAVSDLLVIKAEVPQQRADADDSSDDNGQSAEAAFTSQLYLFEVVGCVSSTSAVPLETKVAISKGIIDALISDLRRNLQSAQDGNAQAVLQIHHVIMALGTVANGCSDWTPGASSGGPPPHEVSLEFTNGSEAVLVALEALRDDPSIRLAARHAFSRLIGVLGSNVLPQLSRWIDGLLSSASSNDEIGMFLRTLGQVVYGFKSEISSILDALLSNLLRRVFAGLSLDITGTDDEVQLRELKQQYLNFILVILNNDLSSVLISVANQGTFDDLIATICRFATDTSDPQSARLAFGCLTRISAVWGGPDLDLYAESSPNPTLTGFDTFMLSQFAPLPWKLVAVPGFVATDAQMRNIVQEAGALQWTMLRKTGSQYQRQLDGELRVLGANDTAVRAYFDSIVGDIIGFRKFFAGFIQQAKR